MLIERLMSGLKQDEGFRSTAYKCTAGKWTIGYGRNIQEKGITIDEAEQLLRNDIADVSVDMRSLFPDFQEYPEDVQYVICNMRFQLGRGGFRCFSKMIGAIKDRNWKRAAKEMVNSKWYSQTPNRAKRLVELMRDAK